MNIYLVCYQNTEGGPTYRYHVRATSFENARRKVENAEYQHYKKSKGPFTRRAWAEGVSFDA